MIALRASYQFREASPRYDALRAVWSNKGNHIITFAEGKIITFAKQTHNCKLYIATPKLPLISTFTSSKNTKQVPLTINHDLL